MRQGKQARTRIDRCRRWLAIFLPALAALALPAGACAAVINFDDLNAPPPGGQGLTVNVQ